ncbi:MATE family efflux transporter [Gryllotalpicola protaetiae]|uniref:MATE family efflux transporter n=1 Tax=Gryllotalpicola protaetiae TaxID=2419771 RepID=A0A387BHY3_9MICO|nr:MATE family efflux transporter [Gryllotalpicola protaetiae]AYG03655.1 MATE family efflux transporter [Gryllotalpicola protaetiae]
MPLLTARAVDREILALAIPALGALIAEPVFLLVDSALVGHLGQIPLAALGLASAVLQTVVGLMVFLAYGTTPAVARRLGAGDRPGAISLGVDGTWLATALGLILGAAGFLTAPFLVGAFGAAADVTEQASAYLRVAMIGLPAMLIVYAATGLLRGLQDTRTPLAVAVAGFIANAGLNALFIYGLGLGIVGSAVGTDVAQWGMVAAYVVVIWRRARIEQASLRPHARGVLGVAGAGWWLLIRTASLRAALLLATWAATRLGSVELAGWQLVMTVFNTLAFALDALAIAVQALIGHGLGAADVPRVRAVLRRCLEWGIGSGVVLGAFVLVLSPWLGHAFTRDANVLAILPVGVALIAVAAPLDGYVFVLDGVLIGAGDARYLALTGLLNLACFVPCALLVARFAPAGVLGFALLSASFAFIYLGARALTLGLRARSPRWLVTGA